MFTLWMAAAAALAAPDSSFKPVPAGDIAPAHLDLSDPAPWLASWTDITMTPAGCWEVVGTASWSYRVGPTSANRGSSAFVARLDEGQWRDIYARSLGEVHYDPYEDTIRLYPHGKVHFVSMVGSHLQHRFSSEGTPQTMRARMREVGTTEILGSLFSSLNSTSPTTNLVWDGEQGGVVLRRNAPLGQGGDEARLEVLFPQGETVPQDVTLVFPDSFRVDGYPVMNVRSGEARIRLAEIDGQLFPQGETVDFTVTANQLRVEASQTIAYHTWRACGAPVLTETLPLYIQD